MSYDLILRNGHVIDPSQNIDGVLDVGFKDGKAAGVGKTLKATPATEIRDVKGYVVTPGLIDLHTHVYWGGTSLGIDADEFCRTSGVTTSIDTGSAGPGNFAGFRKHVIERSEARILAYLHVSFAGIFGTRVQAGRVRETGPAANAGVVPTQCLNTRRYMTKEGSIDPPPALRHGPAETRFDETTLMLFGLGSLLSSSLHIPTHFRRGVIIPSRSIDSRLDSGPLAGSRLISSSSSRVF